jgi:hypothetical protein
MNHGGNVTKILWEGVKMTSPLFIEQDGANRLNLYDGTFKVIEGWFPNAAGDDPNAPIWETIPLVAEGTSAQITAALLDLRDKLRVARNYQKDLLVNTPVYLGMEFDTTEAHSCILKGSCKPAPKIGTKPYLDTTNSQVKLYVLRVLRVPYWEEQTANTKAINNISAWGGTASWTNSEGTRDARITQSYASGIALGKMWLGFRKERGGLTDFDPRFEAEDGWNLDPNPTDTTAEEDTAASYRTPATNNVWQTNFTIGGNNDLQPRWYIQIADHLTAISGTDASHYKGRYLVIAKLKGTDSTTKFGVQLRHGYYSTIAQSANQEIVFQDDGWRSVPLGMVTLPPNPTSTETLIDDDLQKYKFTMYAERISGTGSLRMDGFVLMPTDHLVTVTRNPNRTGGIWKYYFYSRMDGRPAIIGASLVGEIPDQLAEASFQEFKVPLDNSVMVYIREVGADDATANQTMVETDDLYFYYKAAWDDFYVSRV